MKLAGTLEIVPQVVDPWAWLGGGTPAPGAHALAGAAASLSGSAL